MRITAGSNILFDLKNRNHSESEELSSSSPKLDRLILSSPYRQCTAATAKEIVNPSEENSNTVSTAEMQSEIDRLTALLKQDESFVNSNRREYLDHPIGRELASSIILANDDIQEQIAKRMWEDIAQANAMKNTNPKVYGSPMYLPPDYRGYNVKAMLLSGDKHTVDQVLISYGDLLNKKANVSGLTDTERLLSARFERTELAAQGTFNDKMAPVLKEIEKGFDDLSIRFDKSKSYSFTLDTSTFRFSVLGGTDDENAFMEQIINTSNYKKNNLLTSITALYGHRQEDRSYNPWMVDGLLYKSETIPQYGIASVPGEYTKKMELFIPAFERCEMDNSLKTQYGFGIDDIEYKSGGTIVGKTDEITSIIKNAGVTFMKNIGDAYISLLDRYKGTPKFTDAVFTLENGKFHVLYH